MREMQVREAATVQQLQELRDENQQLQQRYQQRHHRYESEILSKDSQLKQKGEQIQSQEREIQTLSEQLEEQEYITAEIQQSLQRQVEQLHHLESTIQSKNSQLKQKDEQVQSREREIQTLSERLEEQESITAEIQKTNNSLQRQVEQPQQQLNQQSEQITKPSQSPLPRAQRVRGRQLQQGRSVKDAQSQSFVQPQKSHPPARHLIEQWQDGGKIPYKITRGAAVVDGSVAYFMDYDGRTCSYDSTKQQWSELPKCPNWNGSLAVIRGLLTVTGGVKQGTVDNKLLSIKSACTPVSMNSKAQMWVEQFPPMPSKRSDTAIVSTKQHLIVAGGKGDLTRLDTVEVMHIETLVWSTAASLPHPYSGASATICGGQLYMLGGLNN